MKNKCKFCDKQISKCEIRCENCNNAWHDGYEQCKKVKELTLNEIIHKIKVIVKGE